MLLRHAVCFLHTGCSPQHISVAVKDGQRPPVYLLPPDVPQELVDCMQKCWAQERQDRPTAEGIIFNMEHYYLTVAGVRMSLAFCFTARRYLYITCMISDRFCSGKGHSALRIWLFACLLVSTNLKSI